MRYGTIVDFVEHCIKRAPFWLQVQIIRLSSNMRVQSNETEFMERLLQIGNGELNFARDVQDHNEEFVYLPGGLFTNNLIDKIYGNDIIYFNALKTIAASRVILSTTNVDTFELNESILISKIPGEVQSYFSADEVVCKPGDEVHEYTEEFYQFIVSFRFSSTSSVFKIRCDRNSIS